MIDLAAVRAGKEESQRLLASMPKVGKGLDPAHAVYAEIINLVSVLCEGLTSLPELDRVTEIIGKAEDEYMPGWPPMSPISVSHFNSWAFFDAAVGLERETIGTCVLDLGTELGLADDILALIRAFQRSRLGLYVHEGSVGDGGRFMLREIVTGERFQAVCSSGHVGEAGEQWLTRLLPPPAPSLDYHVAFTSPYVIELPREEEWIRFFARMLPKVKISDEKKAYEHLMKFGFGHNYWNEYIFEGYWEHTDGMITLLGLPDVAASRPQSREVDGETARLRTYYGPALV